MIHPPSNVSFNITYRSYIYHHWERRSNDEPPKCYDYFSKTLCELDPTFTSPHITDSYRKVGSFMFKLIIKGQIKGLKPIGLSWLVSSLRFNLLHLVLSIYLLITMKLERFADWHNVWGTSRCLHHNICTWMKCLDRKFYSSQLFSRWRLLKMVAVSLNFTWSILWSLACKPLARLWFWWKSFSRQWNFLNR